MTKGWGYKIDYAAALADDERRIAWAKRSIELGWYRRSWPYTTPTMIGQVYEAVHLRELVLRCPDIAASVGFSPQDVADFADSLDCWDEAKRYFPDLPDSQVGSAMYRRGDELRNALTALSFGDSWLYKDEAAARDDLRKAKASRARHMRNQEKYDRRQIRGAR